MTGSVNIKISENGISIDADLHDVDLIDKYELMHSLSIALDLDRREMEVYCAAEVTGVLCNAASVQEVSTNVQLYALVNGGEVSGNEG